MSQDISIKLAIIGYMIYSTKTDLLIYFHYEHIYFCIVMVKPCDPVQLIVNVGDVMQC